MANQNYPKAPVHPDSWQCGSHKVSDPYLYMVDGKNPEVLSWVAEENAYTDNWFKDKKIDEKIALLKNKVKRNPYDGITYMHGKIYAGSMGVDGTPAAYLLNEDFSVDRVLLNGEMMNREMVVFGVLPCIADENLAAFLALKNGAPRLSVIVRDINKNENIACMDGTFSYTWSSDGNYLYSTVVNSREDGSIENSVVRWNRLNNKIETVYTWPGNAVFINISAGPDGRIFAHVCTDYHDVVLICIYEDGRAEKVWDDENANKAYIGSIGNKHYIKTDYNAPLGKIVCIEENNGKFAQVKDIVPEGEFVLDNGCVAGDKILAVTLEDTCSVLKLYDESGKYLKTVELPDPMGSLVLHEDAKTGDDLFMAFESFTCPPSILKYSKKNEAVSVVYTEQDADCEGIKVEKKFVTARDGQKIMAFLVYKEGMEKNGHQPTLFYGYGGYGVCSNIWFNNPFVGLDIVDWVNKGGLYVHTIIRGGGEYGKKWHEMGYMLNKINVFNDFIDITKSVIADGWTDSEHIAICGGSNGGLLTTALTTMEPDLWKCVIASVPHTDMLHFVCDDRGPMYITEYGDPRDDKYFDYMKSYSPYQNIKEGVKYPAMYIQTGENDNNVPPYHGKKFASKMQQTTEGDTVLLRVLPYGSHDRGAGEYFYKTVTEMQTFIEYHLGMLK